MINLTTKKTWENMELLKFSIYHGGNMNGNSHRITVTRHEGGALVTCSDADRHDQEPVIKEYLVDIKVLGDIKEVFLSEGMYRWNRKKFSDRFVADGATTSYNFEFNEGSVDFSSQIYPREYREKLGKLRAVIEKYQNIGKEIEVV